jgi:hypothetical protein
VETIYNEPGAPWSARELGHAKNQKDRGRPKDIGANQENSHGLSYNNSSNKIYSIINQSIK